MQNFNELSHFLAIAEAGSFVRAADKVGVSSSALSHSMRNLETRLNLRLFNRTTRSVSLTEAGKQLFDQVAPLFDAINDEVNALGDFLNTPSGTIRINAPAVAAEAVLYPKLTEFLRQYPKINITVVAENNWVDIVKAGFDMGVRLGDDVAKEMIAVKISEPLKMALVANPDYLAEFGTPKSIDELENHRLIGMPMASQYGELTWQFKEKGKVVSFTPHASFSINTHQHRQAILDGLGIGWVPQMLIEQALADGRLVELLPKTAMTYAPLYLYYPSRKGNSSVFKLVVECLKLK